MKHWIIFRCVPLLPKGLWKQYFRRSFVCNSGAHRAPLQAIICSGAWHCPLPPCKLGMGLRDPTLPPLAPHMPGLGPGAQHLPPPKAPTLGLAPGTALPPPGSAHWDWAPDPVHRAQGFLWAHRFGSRGAALLLPCHQTSEAMGNPTGWMTQHPGPHLVCRLEIEHPDQHH